MTLLRTTTTIAAGCLALSALAACTSGPESGTGGPTADTGGGGQSGQESAEAPAGEAGESQVVASDLEVPWSMAPLPDSRILVSERDSGRILLVDEGEVTPLADVEGVEPGGEGGLLGLALSPEDVDPQRLYVYFTAANDNRVVSYELTGTSADLSLGERQDVLTGIPKAGVHNGGRIAFGPDGKLYVATGDAGQGAASQDPSALGGKILRLEPDGTVPEDNPEAGSPMYSLGHRNVQGLAWDDEDRLWATEFGQNAWDELNLITPGGNYGWPEVEGFGSGGAGTADYLNPVRVWTPEEASPSGLAFIDGTLVMASLRGERLWTIPVPDGEPVTSAEDQLPAQDHVVGEYGRIRDVMPTPGEAGNGTVVDFITSNTDGRGDPAPDDDRLIRYTLDLR